MKKKWRSEPTQKNGLSRKVIQEAELLSLMSRRLQFNNMQYRCKWCAAVRSQKAFDTYRELGWTETDECDEVNNKPHQWLEFSEYQDWRQGFTDFEFEILKQNYAN
jgi:hypothetical protein